MKIFIGERTVELLPAKAVLLEDRTLVVADLHLGKATAFQVRGLPVPEGHSASDLARLAELCRKHDASRVVVNGDLFHSPAGLSPEVVALLEQWIAELGIPLELVTGNHDAKLKRLPGFLTAVPTAEHAGFHLVHDPEDAPASRPGIAAHWHPIARIGEGGRRPMYLPCYLLRGMTLVLPSFGGFTGGVVIKGQPGDRCFVSPAGTVVEVPAEWSR